MRTLAFVSVVCIANLEQTAHTTHLPTLLYDLLPQVCLVKQLANYLAFASVDAETAPLNSIG